jgi:hypothetical protein
VPLVTALNLRPDDPLSEIEKAVRLALTSMPELKINDYEVDLAPVLSPPGFDGGVTRINVDLGTGPRAPRRLSRSSPHVLPRHSRALRDETGT